MRIEGEDDHYPKDVRGNAQENVKFTIRAEKCPNRRGVEAVLQHFHGSIINIGDILGDAAEGRIDTLYFVGGDPRGGLDESHAAALAKSPEGTSWGSIAPTEGPRNAMPTPVTKSTA